MRIAIDGTTLCAPDGSLGAGIEHYTWSIISSLLQIESNHQFFISVPSVLNRVRRNELLGLHPHVTLLPMWTKRSGFLSRHILSPARFALRRADVLFSPYGQVPITWIGKSVMTVHDVAIYHHPEWFPDQQTFSTRFVVPKSVERASSIIAVSNATKEALAGCFPAAESKTNVIYEGVNVSEAYQALQGIDETSSRFPFDRDFILFLGTIEPRKNLVHAFKAFHAFLERRPEQATQVRFIVAGKKGWNTEEIEQELLAVNHAWKHVEPNGVIQFLGPVTEEEKWNLLARASALFFPSWYEGFGLPVLEAMAVGTPAIVSDRGALPEVGGDAVIYVDPEDIESMSFALTQCLLIPEGTKEICDIGFKRVREFSWEKTAKHTLDILESIGQKTSL